MEIKQLDKQLIERANSNSFYNRGNNCESSYKDYVNEVLEWEIPESKKQKILDKLYEKYSKILSYEAQHVPVMVAGPANYNAKKLDKSDQIMQASREFSNWFDDLREQIKNSRIDTNQRELDIALSGINFCVERGWDPRDYILKIAKFNTKKFIELYEKYQPVYKWRKNTNIFKLYVAVLNGEVQEIKKEIIFEDENFTAYIEGDRAYIKFLMKCKQQLIFAMKKRGWWWNAHKGAWSTYLDRVDKEWISSISDRYSDYL